MKRNLTNQKNGCVFSALGTGTCCHALGTRHVFSSMAPVSCFPHLAPRSAVPLCNFLLLAPVACSPALSTRCMFSRARHPLHVFPRFASAVFSAWSFHWFITLFAFIGRFPLSKKILVIWVGISFREKVVPFVHKSRYIARSALPDGKS